MKGNKKEINYKAFIPLGICFMGAGVVFMAAVNPGLGAAMIGLGVLWMLIGLNKKMEGKTKPPRPEESV